MEKYLPIGTVCLLKGAKKRVMITGFCTIADGNKEEIYDYNGCMYPEGVVTAEKTLLFNHNQIEKIYYMGYSDEEDKEFKKNLNELVKQIDSGEVNINDLKTEE